MIYRFYIGVALLLIAIPLAFTGMWDLFWWCITLGSISLISHLLFGPMRVIQEAVQAGDMALANKYMKLVHFPILLIKPVRQGYYMLQSNMAMNNKDYESAENYIKKSIKNTSSLNGANSEGTSYLQLGMIALQNGKKADARKNLRIALEKGLPDNDTKATAYLQLAAIEIQARRLKIGRDYFKKAKNLKPKAAEIKSQLIEMEKYIHRVR